MAATIEGCVTLIPCDGVSMTIHQRILEANISGWQALIGSRIQLNGIFGNNVWYVDSVALSSDPGYSESCLMAPLAPALNAITVIGPGECGQEITSTNCCVLITSCTTGQTVNVALGKPNSIIYTLWEEVVDHLIEIDDLAYPGVWYVEGICCMNAQVDPCADNNACALGGVSIAFNLVTDNGAGVCAVNTYKLTNCLTKLSIYTNTNLYNYIGSVITIQEETGCWSVESFDTETTNTVTLIEGYDDCVCCTGTAPAKYTRIIPKPDRQFYQITQSQCDINANVKFAEGYYRLFKKLKYGIDSACDNVNLEKLWIKKNLSNLATINDPTACVITTPVTPVICPEPS